MSVLIKNGLVICPASKLEAEKDLLVKEGKIEALDKPGAIPASGVSEVIDAKGMWVVPGLVDLHVHLREPGFEWKETVQSGVEAAALGGFSTICSMPNTKPANHNAEITRFIIEQSKRAGLSKVRPIGSVSVELKGQEMAPLSELKEAGCVAFSDDGEPVWDSQLMRRALEWCRMLDIRISCHEEDKRLSQCGCMNESALSQRLGLVGMPKVAEEVMIARDIELARSTKSKVHICHVSSGRSVELIRRAKNDGIDITCEVTPHHLLLSEDAVADYDSNAKMSPPLREAEECEALKLGLKDGTIDAIASDHAPHELDSKRVEFAKAAFGIIGLQSNLPLTLRLVNQGVISRQRAIEAWTSAPSKAFGLSSGTLKKGSAADIAIINPAYAWTYRKDILRSKSANSPFIGQEMLGVTENLLVDGRIVVRAQALRSSDAN